MKRIVTIAGAITLILLTMNLYGATEDRDGHALAGLWKAYYSAVDADKPKNQLTALDAVKEEALSGHHAWDYYDACRKTVTVRARINWKDRDAAQKQMKEELLASGAPIAVVVGVLDSSESKYGYAVEHREELVASCNRQFYGRDDKVGSVQYASALAEFIENDYDFVLWHLFLSHYEGTEIAARYAGAYPMAALVEYETVRLMPDSDARRAALERYASDYSGKAVSLLAGQDLLQERFHELGRTGGGSGAYKELRRDCAAFESERTAFHGSERTVAECCTGVKALMETLDAGDISLEASDGTLSVFLRNVPDAHVSLMQERKVLWERDVHNTVQSCYVPDTISMALPLLDDGSYEIKAEYGKLDCVVDYVRNTLSIASRRDAGGYRVFVTDYGSGMPIPLCDLVLLTAGGKVIHESRGVAMDGFTPLPEDMSEAINKQSLDKYAHRLVLVASCLSDAGKKRMSHEHYFLQYGTESSTDPDDEPRCALFTDRKAFTPGETLSYKAVLYKGTYTLSPGKESETLVARLYDPMDREMASESLSTNEFGSAAGHFQLEKSERGGMYRLCIEKEGRILASTYLRVDEFVLPTFDLNWDADERLYFNGDSVCVRGKIKSYSGHSVAVEKASYSVRGAGRDIDGELEIEGDGGFGIAFGTEGKGWRSCTVTVRITETTGETHEYSRGVEVRSAVYPTMTLTNAAEGSYELSTPVSNGRYCQNVILGEDTARVRFSLDDVRSHPSLDMKWALCRDGKEILSGHAGNGDTVDMDFSAFGSGLYHLVAKATVVSDSGAQCAGECELCILKVSDGDDALCAGVKSFFRELPGDGVALQVGATDGPVSAVAELFGEGDILLDRKAFNLTGTTGGRGSLQTLMFERKADWPENLTLNVLWFREGRRYSYSRQYYIPARDYTLPLAFTRFLDTTRPGCGYTFDIKTLPGAECLAAAFDVGSETVAPNVWRRCLPWSRRYVGVDYSATPGSDGATSPVLFTKAMTSNMALGYAANAPQAMADGIETESARAMSDSGNGIGADGVKVREDFAGTIAWEPFLRSDSDGNVKFTFNTSDKLSTYCVQLFAHDRHFDNNVLRREMTVTVPVKVAVVQPQYIYDTDSYSVRITLSDGTAEDVSGTVSVSVFDGADYADSPLVARESSPMTVRAGGASSYKCQVPVGSSGTLGLLVMFEADDSGSGSDAVFVTVPVHKAMQTLTECHSSILKEGDDRDALEKELRSMFVNVTGDEAVVHEISIRDLLEAALPEYVDCSASDVLSLSAALYADVIASRLGSGGLDEGRRDEMVSKINAARNPDGGFGWFEGMRSSPIVTAVLLERIASLLELSGRFGGSELDAAVKYLDSVQFSSQGRPVWCGGLSLEQYLHVRSLYPAVRFEPGADASSMRAFRKEVKSYLVPSKSRGLQGRILEKARRLSTIFNLLSSKDGNDLARQWGISASKRLEKSSKADVESLLQYAVAHRSGGYYFPNAVLPWRGLLESELYAHTLLCGLFDRSGTTEAAEIVAGIRMWLIVQKDTQQWNSDPACLDALSCVYGGGDSLLDTRVLVLSATTELPFEKVSASGNGFGIETVYSIGGSTLLPGDTLRIGDRVKAEYRVWNEENRSFVRLTAWRPAAFRPVRQLSGLCGLGCGLTGGEVQSVMSPQGYRSVLSDRTEYWFDIYPEEHTVLTEEFLVTQEGTFHSPADEIESLYAPHYRANGDAPSAKQVLP